MTTMRYALLSVLTSFLVLAVAGCTGELSPVDGTPTQNGNPAVAFFDQNVKNGVSVCTGCHIPGGVGPAILAANASTDLRAALLASTLVDLATPANSQLIVYKHPAGSGGVDLAANLATPVTQWLMMENMATTP